MKHVLSVLVNNHAGVLSHVSGLFTRRSYNIDSLSVGETQDPTKSIITLVISEDEEMVKQIEKQLYKLVDVLEIRDLTGEDSLKRELILLTVRFSPEKRAEILTLIDVFKATVVDMTEEEIMIELVANPRRISSFLQTFSKFHIVEMARTGTIALEFPTARKVRN
ncbi:MAG: acetolactate synthase small subunit [Leptospiraceae bacterium]|nr:acetolactate synthase small subunit [Leptospiraceae bacterium]MDW8306290.1 acetolactate synthase small subunit [Leptospiraceae bacterium]